MLGANGMPFNSVGPVFSFQFGVKHKSEKFKFRHGLQMFVVPAIVGGHLKYLNDSMFMFFLTRRNFRLIHRSMRIRNQR